MLRPIGLKNQPGAIVLLQQGELMVQASRWPILPTKRHSGFWTSVENSERKGEMAWALSTTLEQTSYFWTASYHHVINKALLSRNNRSLPFSPIIVAVSIRSSTFAPSSLWVSRARGGRRAVRLQGTSSSPKKILLYTIRTNLYSNNSSLSLLWKV